MDKKVKNIIAIVIMLVMIVCSYFMVNALNNNKVSRTFEHTQKEINTKNNNRENRKKDNNTSVESDKETTTQIETNSDTNTTKTKKSLSKKDNRIKTNQNSSKNNITNKSNKNNTSNIIYYVLFSLESMIFGACGLYLILLNTKKIK